MSRRGPDVIRGGHGDARDAILVTETPALDELTPLDAADTAAALADRQVRGRPFQRGNRAAASRRCALALLGVPLASCDPRYRSAMRKAESYRQRRVRELAVQHGGDLGAGPSAMLANSALALGASRVLYELAGETLDAGMFRQAAALADSARQQELTAVGLASREAQSRPKAHPLAALNARLDAYRDAK